MLLLHGGLYRRGPRSVTFFVTDRCNLRCKMCANHGENINRESLLFHPPVRDISLRIVEKTLRLFPTIREVGFVGVGEPLLVNNLFEMISMAVSKGKICSLITNGVLLEKRIEEIIKSGLQNISISINSPSHEEYSELTGMASNVFFQIGKGVKKLVQIKKDKKLNLKISTSSVVDRSSIYRIPEIVRYINSLGVDALNLHSIIPNPSFPDTYNLILRHKDKMALERSFSLSEKTTTKTTMPILIREVPRRKCLSFFKIINVDGDGNIGGCLRVMPPLKENGNINEGFQCWTNKYFTKWRKKVLNNQLSQEITCRYCVECF